MITLILVRKEIYERENIGARESAENLADEWD
jgi:hypothetical protein